LVTILKAKVGDVLDGLTTLGLDKSTVIIFHADHGYFQGESGEWEKKMLFENTARVLLIIHNPLSPVHRRTTELAELIDVYPTAVALAGFAVPPHLDGMVLVYIQHVVLLRFTPLLRLNFR
jgi:iduronate 2-sulfatase